VIGQQIKSPTQLLVGTAKLLGIGEKTFRNHALRTLPKLGQNLFEPPNVKGWDGGRAWVNSATLLIRYNLTRDLLLQSSREARKGYGKKGSKTKEQSKKKKSGQNDMQMEQMGQMDDQRKRSKRRRASQRPTIGLLKRFESYESADEVINHLILLFLQKPLPESRMAKLREVMSPEGVTFDPKSRQTQERIIKLIILITSIPEYQLC
jgi:hypothetical protein